MSPDDLQAFMSGLEAELRLFGEDLVYEKIRHLQERGVHGANTVGAFYTRYSRSREFAKAQAAHSAAFANGNRNLTAAQEAARQQGIARGVPPVMLISVPKSGSIFLSDALCRTLGVPNLQISLFRFPNDYLLSEALQIFAEGGAVAQTHLDASAENLAALSAVGIRRIHVHVRDPRQATASWAVHVATELTGSRAHQRHLTDPPLPAGFDRLPESVRMEWYAANHFPLCLRWIAQWLHVAERDPRFEVRFTDHAHLKANRMKVVREILEPHGISAETVTEVAVRPPEVGRLHFRQGGNDEWRSVMPPEVQAWMNALLPVAIKRRFGWSDA